MGDPGVVDVIDGSFALIWIWSSLSVVVGSLYEFP